MSDTALQELDLRPLGREDRDALEAAFYRLSDRSRRLRFMAPKPKISPRELTYLTDIDHVRHEALVAVDRRSEDVVGVARYVAVPGEDAEIALEIADEWQRRGLGTLLAERLLERAGENGICHIVGTTLDENSGARGLLRHLGFHATGRDGAAIEFELDVTGGRCPTPLAA